MYINKIGYYCEMIILTQKKNSDWWRYSTLKIPHFKDMDNLMIMLNPLFLNCAMKCEKDTLIAIPEPVSYIKVISRLLKKPGQKLGHVN